MQCCCSVAGVWVGPDARVPAISLRTGWAQRAFPASHHAHGLLASTHLGERPAAHGPDKVCGWRRRAPAAEAGAAGAVGSLDAAGSGVRWAGAAEAQREGHAGD